MANYAVRIYDADLKSWLIAEAARRGRGIRTSDIVEAALLAYREMSDRVGAVNPSDVEESDVLAEFALLLRKGSDAPVAEVSAPSARPVRRRPASDRPADVADAVAEQTVVQPVPPVDPRERLDLREYETPAVLKGISDLAARVADDARIVPVQRVKGHDSGPDDDNLGF